MKKGGIFQALELLDQAIEHDPHYGPALALAASSRQLLEANNWTDDPETNRRKGNNLALQALRFAPDDPKVLAVCGFALGLFGEDINAAIRLIERSLILNPSFARGWQLSGVLRVMAGQPDLAIEHFKTSSLEQRPEIRDHVSGITKSISFKTLGPYSFRELEG